MTPSASSQVTRSRSLWHITGIYLVTAAAGALTAWAVEAPALWQAAIADVIMTVVLFGFSVWRTNTSVYDAYWSVFPFLLCAWLWFTTDGVNWSPGQWMVMLMVSVWSWRLTLNWARGWPGWHHEDWRYGDFRTQQSPATFQLTNFFGLHLFPTIMVFLGCLGLFTVATEVPVAPGIVAIGTALGCIGINLEYVADNQIHAFRQRPDRAPGEMLQSGLWGIVRYPNYLGEMLFWWGVALCGLGYGAAWWVTGGAVAMMIMFKFASIPLKDTRMQARYPEFTDYAARVPALLPRRIKTP